MILGVGALSKDDKWILLKRHQCWDFIVFAIQDGLPSSEKVLAA